MSLEDPAKPAEGELAVGLALADAMRLANGEVKGEVADFALEKAAPMPVDIDKALAFLNACMTSRPRVTYGLGAKASSDASLPGDPSPPGFVKIDCSGFTRAAIRRSTNPEALGFPDGSVVQHAWTKAQGFPQGAVDDGDKRDGLVRIAFLPPSAVPSGIGHVVLIYQGETLESHGGVGPDRRQWNLLPWRVHTDVFELTW